MTSKEQISENGDFIIFFTNATISSTFKRVMFRLVRSKVHKNKVAQNCATRALFRQVMS